jgi:hypothetical protein
VWCNIERKKEREKRRTAQSLPKTTDGEGEMDVLGGDG